MTKKLYIGNLAYTVTDDALNAAFSQFGTVQSATVVRDKMSGRSKGFGFVEMSTEAEAAESIEKLNKSPFEGRTMFVSESISTGDKPSSSRGGGNFRKSGGGDRGDRGNNRRPY